MVVASRRLVHLIASAGALPSTFPPRAAAAAPNPAAREHLVSPGPTRAHQAQRRRLATTTATTATTMAVRHRMGRRRPSGCRRRRRPHRSSTTTPTRRGCRRLSSNRPGPPNSNALQKGILHQTPTRLQYFLALRHERSRQLLARRSPLPAAGRRARGGRRRRGRRRPFPGPTTTAPPPTRPSRWARTSRTKNRHGRPGGVSAGCANSTRRCSHGTPNQNRLAGTAFCRGHDTSAAGNRTGTATQQARACACACACGCATTTATTTSGPPLRCCRRCCRVLFPPRSRSRPRRGRQPEQHGGLAGERHTHPADPTDTGAA